MCVAPDQTAKNFCQISIWRLYLYLWAPARLLSDRGTSFTSSIIEEMCKIFDDLPVKLPWGGKMESCGLYHGHLPEHPPRMGEDHR